MKRPERQSLLAAGTPIASKSVPDGQGGTTGYRTFEPRAPNIRESGTHPRHAGVLADDALEGTPFARLDRDLPLLLLPIRIETRYDLASDPPALRIRIYPDQIHIDADFGEPSTLERDLACEFWTAWHADARADARDAAWRTLVRQAGARRAGHLARVHQPTLGTGGVLIFPDRKPPAPRPLPRPVLLPRQWLAIGYAGGEQIFRKASRRIATDLRIGADPAAPTSEISDGALAVDAGLAWMIDYRRAEAAGMAITVPLTGAAAPARRAVDVLLVLGVDERLAPAEAASQLSRLLDVHSRTTGFAFVPQGTPTNNTESVAAGWSPQETDADVGSARALRLTKNPPSGRGDNAARLVAALGLPDAEIFRRVAHGDEREAVASQDMRVVAFDAVVGTFLRELLDVATENGVGAAAVTAVRQWFIDHVTGGAPVPTVRIGPQPYGILPVRRSAAQPDLSTTRGQVERIVKVLMDVWRRSAAQVPTLDSDQADIGSQGDPESVIASILATQPHPARLFTRVFEEYGAGVTPFTPQATYAFQLGKMTTDPPEEPRRSGFLAAGFVYLTLLNAQYPNGLTSIDDQIDLWNQTADTLRDSAAGDTQRYALDAVESVLSVLGSYEGRQRPLRWVGLDRFAGVLGEQNTRLVAGLLHAASVEWGDAGLIEHEQAESGGIAATYLSDLRARFVSAPGASGSQPSIPPPPSPAPLLYQLIAKAQVPARLEARQRMLDALDRLARLDPRMLEWLLRETLGLGAHRLDAWFTSLASERLARVRAARPAGVHVGAFGWVIDLKPREQRRSTEGFIHAPSMSQATTAALLRAGWHAHGTEDASSPAAVDLRSHRVRTAEWLLEGTRQGQLLGDLLGYRFERSLHDLDANDQIRPVRQLVLEATGRPDASPDGPVDGIALLGLFRGRQLGAVSPEVTRALHDLEAAFDAVNDVALFESVHQLAAGNNERATAMLDAMSLGTIAPPELRGTRTARSAVSVEHRVVILLKPTAVPQNRGWSTGIRDAIAPALEAWVVPLLPPADQVGFSIVPPAGPPSTGTLRDLKLSALDAVYLLGDDPRETPAALRTLAAGRAGLTGSVRIDPTSPGDAAVSLADFCVVAAELRRLLETLRPLDARDLRPASAAGEADTDTSQGVANVRERLGKLVSWRDRLNAGIKGGGTDDMAIAVDHFARLGISTGDAPRDVAGAEALLTLVERRMAHVGSLKVDASDPHAAAETRLAALLTRRVPILGVFTLAGADGGPVIDVKAGPPGTADVDEWLEAVGRVRAEAGKLSTIGMLSELLGAAGLRLRAGQYPITSGESWAASHRPHGPGRVSIVAACGPESDDPPGVGKPVCGLVVDRWSEPVPGDQQATGVTFQFDAPGNRPPQTWLLAVTPDSEPWSLKLVADTVLETLEWACLRAVGPEDLVDYGRAIPTTFVPGNVVNWPEES
jgi:hypothetical protein